jgi:hypothetical protein
MKVNRQRTRSQRNSISVALRKRIGSLVKKQLALNQAMLQRVRVIDKVEQKVNRVEPLFTYNIPCPERRRALIITQEEEDPPKTPTSVPSGISTRVNGSLLPRTAGIAATVLNQFTGNTFLDKIKRTLKVNEPPLKPEEVACDVVHQLMKGTIIKYK